MMRRRFPRVLACLVCLALPPALYPWDAGPARAQGAQAPEAQAPGLGVLGRLGGALGLPGLGANPVRLLLEQVIERATGGRVVLRGLSGSFPDTLRLERLEVHDADGAWLVAEDVALDWSPTRLLRRQAALEGLTAARVQVPRLPRSDPASAPDADTSGGFSLPVDVAVQRLHVDRLELGAPVLGAAAALAAEGRVELDRSLAGQGEVRLRRLDRPGGEYGLRGRLDAQSIQAVLDVDEPAGGLIAQVAGLPEIGPLRARAEMDGPRRAEAVQAVLDAGPLHAEARGTVDLVDWGADLDVTANAPAMAPRPDLSWQSVSLRARVRGPFTRPEANGTLTVEALAAVGASLARLSAAIEGDAGRIGLRATADGLRLPGPAPEVFAASPLRLDADARLDDPARPVSFTLSHPLLSATGQARTAGDLSATADLRAAEIAPFAALGGVDARGSAALSLRASVRDGATDLDVDGTVGITGGQAPLPGLIGRDARLGLGATLRGSDVRLRRASLDGQTLHLTAEGGIAAGRLDLSSTVALADLSVLAPTLAGHLDVRATAQGPTDSFTATADATGEVGGPGVRRGPLRVQVRAEGLPGAPTGRVLAEGTLDGAPLALDVTARREADGALHATIHRADWRSAHAEGTAVLPPGATVPRGRVALRMTRLEDLRGLLGRPVSGALRAEAELDAAGARVEAEGNGGVPGARVGRFALDAKVSDPLGRPAVQARLSLDGLDAGGVAGSARLEASGPQDAVALHAGAELRLAGADARVSADAVLDVPDQTLRLSAFQAVWQGETLRLLAPVQVGFADGLTVDRLRLGLRGAVLEAAGRVSPALDLTASLRGLPADLAARVSPDLAADGTLSTEARLTGTPARPQGTVRVQAAGVRLRAGPGRALPPAGLDVSARLDGESARLDGRLTAGALTRVALSGRVPLDPAGAFDLRAQGALDLAALDPLVAAGGRRVRGRLDFDLGAAGTAAAPRLNGTARLSGGEVQDFAQGVRVDDIAGTVRAEGDRLRIVSLQGRAGSGTIQVAGSVGVLAPDLPVDVAVTMRRARLLSSDRLSATLDADLTARGSAAREMLIAGRVVVLDAEARVPERLPTTVVTLDVRRPGQTEESPPGPPVVVGLDVRVDAPRAVFVRGRGLDAELSGRLHVRGTTAEPQVAGAFEMRRGTFGLAGTTLTFTRGRVSFDGGGLTGRLDPSLDFVAESTANSVTARMAVGGYASAPKITFSSTPELPQDEVLAQLLFRRSIKDLSPFEIASIAAALAEATGVISAGSNPLDRVRRGLGLDRLSVGGGANGAGPTLEAGRYIGRGVYVGARQGTTGAQTQATVQVDITRGLKLQTELGTGARGNSVGLSYQYEW